MNAKKVNSGVAPVTNSVASADAPLKFLSTFQRKKTDKVAKDWKRFSLEVFSGIYDKL